MPQATTTFLQLCQQVARDSGTVSGVKPATVVGQVDQLKQVVEWTKDAWVLVQAAARWPWMRAEFSKVTVAETASYLPTAWSLTDVSQWIQEPATMSLYLTATGVSDEGFLKFIDYRDYRVKYGIGTQVSGRPSEWSVNPSGAFVLGPKPDAVYTVRGEYWKSPQLFSANADVPTGLPEEYKNVIVYRALIQFGEYDEAPNAVVAAARNYTAMLTRMQRELLPQVTTGGSLLL